MERSCKNQLAIHETLVDPFGCYTGKKARRWQVWPEGWSAMQVGRDRYDLAGIAVGWAALLAGAIAVVAIATEPASLRVASNDSPAVGASGLARPHQPLDRAPGEPLDFLFAREKSARRVHVVVS